MCAFYVKTAIKKNQATTGWLLPGTLGKQSLSQTLFVAFAVTKIEKNLIPN
jgi:hypothetical protein